MNIAPLHTSFMLASMFGGIASLLVVYPRSPSFGASFLLVFSIMFVASVISFIYAPVSERLR